LALGRRTTDLEGFMGLLDRFKPLGDLPRFGNLSGEEMRQVCDAGREVNVPDGWSLLTESTPPDQAYIVIKGELQVSHHGKKVAELGPGDIVGEIGVTKHRLRTGTVTALTPLVMLHLTGDAFNGLYRDLPAFKSAVDSTMEERLAELSTGDASE
jgi:CRP/FNR family cyclic AMP-dependent transcriptional regulator